MHARLFDVLHDACDQHVFAIRERIHVHFRGVFQKPVDQHRAILREGHRLAHVFAHGVFVVGDHHGAPAQHIAGPHQHGIPDPPRDGACLLRAGRRAVLRRRYAQIVEQLTEQLAVLGQIDVLRIGADDRHALPLQRQRQRERRLPAKLHDHAVRPLGIEDVQHVLQRQGFKVQPVAGVVIRRNRFRITVHHNGFVAQPLQGERGVAAAVIELNPLPDAVRAAAEDHHLLAIGRVRLAGAFVA